MVEEEIEDMAEENKVVKELTTEEAAGAEGIFMKEEEVMIRTNW